ncbi:MAG: CBS domain-containing protein [Candidatus Krumholzibacteriota bacterium]
MSELSGGVYDLERPVRSLMKDTLIGIEKDQPVQEAAKRMSELGISSMVAMDGDEIVGFFTDSDINRKVVARGLGVDTPVGKIMNRKLITIDAGSSIRKAIELMTRSQIKHLLVTEKDEIVAILTFGDIFAADKHMIATFISRD